VNLDFGGHPLFSWYVILLLLSGVVMLAMAAVKAESQSVGWRIFNALLGLGFVGYGIYLGFIFQGGTYIVFFKVFIVPALMIINFIRSKGGRRKAAAAGAPTAGRHR
jgi:hypothetical protein